MNLLEEDNDIVTVCMEKGGDKKNVIKVKAMGKYSNSDGWREE